MPITNFPSWHLISWPRLGPGPVRCTGLLLLAREKCCPVNPASRWDGVALQGCTPRSCWRWRSCGGRTNAFPPSSSPCAPPYAHPHPPWRTPAGRLNGRACPVVFWAASGLRPSVNRCFRYCVRVCVCVGGGGGWGGSRWFTAAWQGWQPHPGLLRQLQGMCRGATACYHKLWPLVAVTYLHVSDLLSTLCAGAQGSWRIGGGAGGARLPQQCHR